MLKTAVEDHAVARIILRHFRSDDIIDGILCQILYCGQNIMERELNLPLDLSNHNPVLIDGFPSQVLAESLAQSTFFGFNSQDQLMSNLPMVSSLTEDPMKELCRNHGDIMSSNGLLINNTSAVGEGINMDDLPGSSQNLRNRQLRDICIGGTPIASSFANDIGNLAVSLQHDVPSEAFGAFGSSSCSNASTSLVVPSLNCEYDGLVGDVNNKWDLNRFLMQQGFNWQMGLQPIQFGEPNEWISPSDVNVCPSHPHASSNINNELSLSLGTCGDSVMHGMNTQDQGSDTTSGTSRELSLSFSSSSSSAQFSQILSGSRYLRVAQEILSEIASYSYENIEQITLGSVANFSFASYYPLDQGISFTSPDEILNVDGLSEAPTEPSSQRREVEVKSQLLSLLQMVDDRYNQCLDEIHTVASAFHAATELDPQIHARFALCTVSFMYKNLRERISHEILRMGMHVDNVSLTEKERSFEKSFIQKQWALQQLKRKDHQLWRPQRGLPERSVSVLRAWMFQNFLHPYPKDAEKHLLAIRSGLTRSQVSNWFINARVRLWKPLIEEMYAELNRKKARQNEDGASNSNCRSHLNIYNQRFSLD